MGYGKKNTRVLSTESGSVMLSDPGNQTAAR